MATEPVVLHTRDRRDVTAEAEVVRYGPAARYARAGGILAVGIAVGAGSIVIPVVHLIVPWLAPLLALGIAVWVGRQAVNVREIRASCPDCAVPFAASGGPVSEDLWVRCPKCALPLRVEVR